MHVHLIRAFTVLHHPTVSPFRVKAGKEGRYVSYSFSTEKAMEMCVSRLVKSGYKVASFYA